MIIDSHLETSFLSTPTAPFNAVVMAEPSFFEVVYAINPFMKDSLGQLQKVDKTQAVAQWNQLASLFRDLNLQVFTLSGVLGLPDLVFTANQSFPFWNSRTNKYEVILSRMRSQERQNEVSYLEQFWKTRGFTVHKLNHSGAFESNGDAIYSPVHGLVFGGYGSRTDKEVYAELSERFGLTIVRLELCSKDFYHLDTCFSILSKEVVAIQPEAFSSEGLKLIHSLFSKVISIPYEENLKYFCGNCFCPDGSNVILQKGSPAFARELTQLGFTTWEVETGEFMKSGGSVFCLKLFVPG